MDVMVMVIGTKV